MVQFIFIAFIIISITVAHSSEVNILASLKQKLGEKLKWTIDENVKADCCYAAFQLCEAAPAGVDLKPAKRLLAIAKRKCRKIQTFPMDTEDHICQYYSSNPVNCAYTPNTAEDFDVYLENLPDCCSSAKTYCADQSDVNLYNAKKDCYAYAIRTPEEICQEATSDECAA
jgi:hypothetical protein